jgi:hypothetical protein
MIFWSEVAMKQIYWTGLGLIKDSHDISITNYSILGKSTYRSDF